MKIIFDLDGTLANLEHRLHYIRKSPRDYDAFYDACDKDLPIYQIVTLNKILYNTFNDIFIWSGRRESTREKTLEWLYRYKIQFNAIRFRKDGDFRDDVIVKEEWLHELPNNQWPDLVFDDRKRVVDMWRRNGIKCCQVEEGLY
jgi:phosphoglycolate phosphatase-like HAD superfamily hydrolase